MLAVLADVHGNLTALEAVLADMAAFPVAEVLCLGDATSFGPQPRETLRRLRELRPRMVLGNTDAYLLAPRTLADVPQPDADTPFFLAVEAWSAEQLLEDDLVYVRTFEPTVRLERDSLRLLAYHGSPRSYDDLIRATTPDEVLDAYLTGEAADLYLGAHTHEQFVRRYRASRVLNPGSVGLSFVALEGRGVYRPVAEYALLEVDRNEPNLTFRRVPYDFATYARSVRASGMPYAEQLLEGFG